MVVASQFNLELEITVIFYLPCPCIIIIISARSLFREDPSFIKASIISGFIWPSGGFGMYVIGWTSVVAGMMNASFSVYQDKMHRMLNSIKHYTVIYIWSNIFTVCFQVDNLNGFGTVRKGRHSSFIYWKILHRSWKNFHAKLGLVYSLGLVY